MVYIPYHHHHAWLNSLSQPLQCRRFSSIVRLVAAVRGGVCLCQFNIGQCDDGSVMACVFLSFQFFFSPAYFGVTRLVTDGRFSISLLSQMFCHG